MKYILDNEGYVEAFSPKPIVHDGQVCNEYVGTVPSGYSSIEDWVVNANIRAYKIIDDNLVYDANRDAELQRQYAKEKEENALVTKKYVDSQLSGINVSGTKNLKELFDANNTNDFKIIQLTDTSDFEINKLVIKAHTSNDTIDIIFNTLNMLPNELLSTSKGGLSFNVLADKSIEVSGTTSEALEIDLAGTNTSVMPILTFKKGVKYYLSGLEETKLNMYYYDGTNRTQVYSGFGGSILFDESVQVTEITLIFDEGTNIDKTIQPMLNLGDSALDYEKYDIKKLNITLPTYEHLTFSEDLFLSDTLYPKYWGDIQVIIESGVITIIDEYERLLGEIAMPSTFYPSTTIYAIQDTTMNVNYITSSANGVPYDKVIEAINNSPEEIKIKADKIKLEGYTTINDGFAVDLGGNFNANSGTIGGITVNGQGLFYNGGSANDGFGLWKNNIHHDGTGYIIFNAGGNTSNIGGSPFKLYQNGYVRASSGSIGSWNLSNNGIYGTSSAKAGLYTNGNMIMAGDYGMIKFDTNPVRITTANKLLISDNYSASEMASSYDTISVRAFNGQIHLNSNSAVYAGTSRLDGSSSRAVKTNIKPMGEEYINDIYKAVKEMPLYTYDYLEEYGNKDDFGFVIEDIEDTCLNRTLKITQNQDNELVKNYGTLELNKMNLVLIKELMNKIETLEKRIEELESDNNGDE